MSYMPQSSLHGHTPDILTLMDRLADRNHIRTIRDTHATQTLLKNTTPSPFYELGIDGRICGHVAASEDGHWSLFPSDFIKTWDKALHAYFQGVLAMETGAPYTAAMRNARARFLSEHKVTGKANSDALFARKKEKQT